MIINKIILKNWLDYAKKIQWSKFPRIVVKKNLIIDMIGFVTEN